MPLAPELIAAIPETLTYDDGGVSRMVRDHPFVANVPDFPTFVKNAFEAHRGFGERIPVRVKDDADREVWRKTHLPKLQDAGILRKPFASPDDYGQFVKKPEKLIEGLGWSDEYAGELKSILHKHDIAPSAVAELLALHEKTLLGTNQIIKASYDDGMAKLKATYGNELEAKMEQAKQLTDFIFEDPGTLELFERSGLGNDPRFLDVMIKLAKLAEQDSSFFVTSESANGGPGARSSGKRTHEEVMREVTQIATDPKHPMNARYNSNDPEVHAYVERLYQSVFGTGKVEVG